MTTPRPGQLRIYLGSAAGVGKTYAMLVDARAAMEEGADVVVGYLEPHGRERTESQASGLEQAPVLHADGPRAQRGVDVEWLVARAPSIALVDELAHTNASGSLRGRRYEDVEALLVAGIDVWTTVNVQHLHGLNERVFDLVGVRVRETFPDRVLHDATEIRLIDVGPAALRERIARGLVYRPDRVDAALMGFFTFRNLTALRALALHELAENAAQQLSSLDAADAVRSGVSSPVERVLVAVGGRSESIDRLLRRADRIARRSSSELVVLHVRDAAADSGAQAAAGIERASRIAAELGAAFLERVAEDVAGAIVHEAQAVGASQVVVGASARGRWRSVFSPGPIDAIMRAARGIDLHVVARPASEEREA